MTNPLVLGLDIGGTASRALLVDAVAGHRIATGEAAGGNPSGHPVDEALGSIATALRRTLSGVDPGRVAYGLIGLAGVGRLQEPAVAAQFAAMWRQVGLGCPYQVVADADVAFAAGSPAPHGTLLLAGTGAIAAEIRDRRLRRIADGHGWLLGDLGSGFWIGREAVRAVLAYLDGWGPASGLVRRLLTELIGDPDPPVARETTGAVVNAVRCDSPVELARFARAVLECAADGDPIAIDIAVRAAGQLIETASLVRPADHADEPLVLAGGLLIRDTPVADAVRQAAADRWPGAPIRLARDGAGGAAWLAAVQLGAADCSPGELHLRLLGDPR